MLKALVFSSLLLVLAFGYIMPIGKRLIKSL